MTTKQAAWVAKMTAQNKKIRISYQNIECENITDDDLKSDYKYLSEHNFANPYKGIYTWYSGDNPIYTMCVKDKKTNCIYQSNISNLEIIR